MRGFVVLLMMAAIASAFGVQADAIDIKDTGNENLEALDVAIFIDCGLKNITAEVKGQDSEQAVAGASAYLFYTDYEYQLIATGMSDAEGRARINVLGNQDYLTALFILRIDKSGYRSREIEFSYEKCFREPPEPVLPPVEEPEEEPEEEPADVTPPAEPPPAGETKPPAGGEIPPGGVGSPEDDETPVPGPAPAACPLGLAVLSLVFLKTRC